MMTEAGDIFRRDGLGSEIGAKVKF
jgi:hypothetical protein